MAGCALLLLIDLLALPWFEISVDGLSFSSTATQEPDGWLGVLAVLGCAVLLGYLLVERLSPQTQLPVIGGSRATTRLLMAAVTAGLIALKFILHIHFSLFGIGFYIAIILVVGLVVYAERLRSQEPYASATSGT